MSQLHKLQLFFLLFMFTGIGAASSLVLSALRENISLFYTPTHIVSGEVAEYKRPRAGGVGETGSLRSAHSRYSSIVQPARNFAQFPGSPTQMGSFEGAVSAQSGATESAYRKVLTDD